LLLKIYTTNYTSNLYIMITVINESHLLNIYANRCLRKQMRKQYFKKIYITYLRDDYD